MTDAEIVEPESVAEPGDEQALAGDVEELIDVAAQRDEYLALAQRTQADFENYRRRVARESALASERGAIKLARELLPALDNLDRALEAAAEEAAQRAGCQSPAAGRPSSPSDGGPGEPGGPTEGRSTEDSLLLQGVRLVREEIAAALARVGIESFSPAGEPFDPAFHEAVAHQPVEGAPSGAVAEVYQPGYRLGEHVIRPARVVVAA